MPKWIYDKGKVTLEYPTLGFTAKVGDILDADAPPDRRWSLCGDQEAAETVFHIGDLTGHVGATRFTVQELLNAAALSFNFATAANAMYQQTSAPSNPDADGRALAVNDVWFDDYNQRRRWTGSVWTDATVDWLATNPTSEFPNVVLSSAGIAAYDSLGNLVTSIDTVNGTITTSGSVWVNGDISGATVTGGVVQTDAAADTGIKINTAGFAAYDAGGDPTVTIDAATGEVIILGGLLSGGTLQTAASGKRVVIDPSGVITCYDSGGASASIEMAFGEMAFNATLAGFSNDLGCSGDLITYGTLLTNSVGGNGFPIYYSDAIDLNSHGIFHCGTLNGVGDVNASGSVNAGGSFFDTSLSGGGGTGANINNNGKIIRTPSSERFKTAFEALPMDLEALAALVSLTFEFRDPDEHGEGRFPGVTAEKAQELGFDDFVNTDSEGRPNSFRYPEFGTVAAIHLAREVVDLRGALADALARIEALEAS